MENTLIEWAHHTFNMWWGCSKVSAGCKNCYAESFSSRLGMRLWGPNHGIKPASEDYIKQPYKWDKAAEKSGLPTRVFSNSMSDVFERHAELPPLRAKLFEIIKDTPNLTWMLLTKHPDNIADMIPNSWHESFPNNVWIGTSVEGPESLWRLDYISSIPSPVHFVSIEPLLAPLAAELARFWATRSHLDDRKPWWLLIGGESGNNARQMDVAWASELISLARDYQFARFTVIPYVKQLGSVWAKEVGAKHKKGGDIEEWPQSLRVREVPYEN